jgi:uncharacterized protein YwqG
MLIAIVIILILIFFYTKKLENKKNIKRDNIKIDHIDFTHLLEPMKKSSIRIAYDSNTDTECLVGSSKIGGKPDLPIDFEWFYFNGESYDGITKNRPLSFLAQINCEEINEYDKDNLLPANGMLYFFYELETMKWGGLDDKGSTKVYYYPGSISELQRTDFPSDLLEEYKLPEMSITFSTEIELPDFEEFIEWHNEVEYNQWDSYGESKNKIIPESDERYINKLLGYANLIQSDMLLECEAATRGVELYSERGGYSNKITTEELQQYKENCTKWQLLFQFDSIETGTYELLWGDVGRIYYYINIDDLVELNFDNCWLILQCT